MASEVQGDLAGIFEAMARRSLEERKKINDAGMDAFEPAFRANYHKKVGQTSASPHIIDTLVRDHTNGGTTELGFSKAGKKAYLARFLNDGWIPRNGAGGPYAYHPERAKQRGMSEKEYDQLRKQSANEGGLARVPGRHFWEDTENDANVKAAITRQEVAAYNRMMSIKAHRGGQS